MYMLLQLPSKRKVMMLDLERQISTALVAYKTQSESKPLGLQSAEEPSSTLL